MTTKWLEINKASEVLKLDLEYLCDLVIKGSIKTSTCDNHLLIDVSDFSNSEMDSFYKTSRNVNTIKKELEDLKVESAWLKSENMMNSKLVQDYHLKFKELKRIQEELVEVINHQSETIRALKGYHTLAKDNKPEEMAVPAFRNRPSISFWMLLPVMGLALAALIELCKANHIYNLSELTMFLGLK